jgi:ribosomal protein L40E
MTFVAGIILIAVAFVVVAWPFFRKRPEDDSPLPRPELIDRWEVQKNEAYGAIKDAEYDLQTGKMSQADFQFIRDKYAARAIEAIGALEQSKAKARGASPRGARFLFCPDCGSKLPPRAQFCPGCGRSLRADDAA